MVKGTWIVLGVLAGLGLLTLGVVGATVGTYNELVREETAVDTQAKQVDVQYQRAFRLLPQIERLAGQYLQNETTVMTQVAALRSGLGQALNGSYEQKDEYVAQLNELILLVGNRAEAYPQLRADRLYQEVITERINTENKIAAEKTRYNDRVGAFNAHIRECCLPLLVSRMAGFEAKEFIGFSNRPNQGEFPADEPL